ncbi:MAG: cupin [Acidimicrobiia bacterium]|nr:cupin [Acidimicrobiia bacterium]
MSKTEVEIRAVFKAEGLVPHSWSNGAGVRYGPHEHPYHKVLYCVEGSITFHTDQGDIKLSAGDRLDLAPETRHAATVGPTGVACLEAARPVR